MKNIFKISLLLLLAIATGVSQARIENFGQSSFISKIDNDDESIAILVIGSVMIIAICAYIYKNRLSNLSCSNVNGAAKGSTAADDDDF